MAVNFAMWRKATSSLVRMDSKQEWDRLDVVSKWLIATRSGVTTVTLYSCTIAGLFAARSGTFPWLTWLIVTLGLFLAHGANNLLNDYTDYSRGIDSDNYFRTQYGVHPLVQGFWDRKTQMRWFVASGILALLSAVFAIVSTGFDPVVIGLVAYGAVMLLLYTWPLKYLALGELTIFLIWGPIMIGGVFFVLTRVWSWDVVLAGVPVGLGTASINIGKHIDKSSEDRKKGVTTLPVLIGEAAARVLNVAAITLAYAITLYMIVVPRFLTPALLIVFLAAPSGWKAIQRLSKPRPAAAPPGYPIWPRWFSTVAFVHNRKFGNLFILGVAVDTVLRLVFPAFWR